MIFSWFFYVRVSLINIIKQLIMLIIKMFNIINCYFILLLYEIHVLNFF